MSASFLEQLEARCRAIDSLLCVGIDPRPDQLAEPSPEALRRWCLDFMDATRPWAACFKPNSAFFEAWGPEGLVVLGELIAHAGEVPLLLDAKRGDIGSTAEAYARASFERLGAGAVTLSPYLGPDSLEPFLRYTDRAVFVLCRTSNPGGSFLQELPCPEGAVFERVARWAEQQPEQRALVVGATQPAALQRVRRAAPRTWLLAPGVGAQGGDPAEAIRAGVRADGWGLLVSVSRALSRAPSPAEAAEALCQILRQARSQALTSPEPHRTPQEELADAILDAGCLRWGEFTLRSGLRSPFYLDLRRLSARSETLRVVGRGLAGLLEGLEIDALAALPTAGLPLGTACALAAGLPLGWHRSQVKAHGLGRAIEGGLEPGQSVCMVDDLVTRGTSALEALQVLRDSGLQVRHQVAVLDRASGGRALLAEAGVQLHTLLEVETLLQRAARRGEASAEQLQAALDFLQASQAR